MPITKMEPKPISETQYVFTAQCNDCGDTAKFCTTIGLLEKIMAMRNWYGKIGIGISLPDLNSTILCPLCRR